MRQNTLKRAALNRAAAKVRKQIVAEVGQCELTGVFDTLALHEIARGGSRGQSQDKRYAVLCLANKPIDGGLSAHRVVERWPVAKQLMLLRWNRPDDFDLAAFNQLVNRRVTEEEVLEFADEVQMELGAYQPGFDLWA